MADYKKPDYWQQKARKEGYPARSVYKLKEIDEKFDLFMPPRSGALRVLDLGAAPGSWSLYVLRKMASIRTRAGSPLFLAAADLSPLSREFDKGLFDGDNFFFIHCDITNARIRETLIAHGPYSAIISDAAPATSGSRTIDTSRSHELAEAVVDYAESALIAGGALTLKIFQGDGSASLLKRMKAFFETTKSFKPQSCRGNSMETYYIALGRKPPSVKYTLKTSKNHN
jgi:23S rRNA (uridine2552-2'-O)-methyltransferase